MKRQQGAEQERRQGMVTGEGEATIKGNQKQFYLQEGVLLLSKNKIEWE